MKDFAGSKKIIRKCLNKWITPLGLAWWKIDVYYHVDKKHIKKVFGSSRTRAQVNSDWRYGDATVHFNLPAFTNLSDGEIEMVVLHELVHVLVCEMREGEMHHEERVVTGLTKAFMWTREAD